MIDNKKPYILCAAVHFKDGIVYKHQPVNIESGIVVCGRRHHNCILTYFRLKPKAEGLKRCDNSQGFLTSDDRFLNRKEAYILAIEQNQVLTETEPHVNHEMRVLFSEDLYEGKATTYMKNKE